MINIHILGEGHLADATTINCQKWFHITPPHIANLVWCCIDTPVDDDDNPDTDYVINELSKTLDTISLNVPVFVSSQLPVGTCARLESQYPLHHIISQPENIRKKYAVDDFGHQKRIIVGSRDLLRNRGIIIEVLSKFTYDPDNILFMSPESAEMVKHTLNAWLAMNIVFANELAELCAYESADVEDVFEGFRSDERVKGPLTPGFPYTGGTLGRDVKVLCDLTSDPSGLIVYPLLHAIRDSNTRRLHGR